MVFTTRITTLPRISIAPWGFGVSAQRNISLHVNKCVVKVNDPNAWYDFIFFIEYRRITMIVIVKYAMLNIIGGSSCGPVYPNRFAIRAIIIPAEYV